MGGGDTGDRPLENTARLRRSNRYRKILDALREELGYVDYLGALQRYRLDDMSDPKLLLLSTNLEARHPAQRYVMVGGDEGDLGRAAHHRLSPPGALCVRPADRLVLAAGRPHRRADRRAARVGTSPIESLARGLLELHRFAPGEDDALSVTGDRDRA